MTIRNLTDADYPAVLALYRAMGMDFQYHVMEKKL